MDRKLGIVVFLGVFGVSAAARADIDVKPSIALLDKYASCLGAAVTKYAPTTATATEVVDAAEGACNREWTTFRLSLEDAFIAGTRDRSAATASAGASAAERRASLRSKAMALVLDLRLKAQDAEASQE